MNRFWISMICLASASGMAQVNPAAPTTQWHSIDYSSSSVVPDPSLDQQTGSEEGDVVGSASQPAFYTTFDGAGTPSTTDGTLAFRVRVGADKSPAGYAGAAFVGIDVNRDGKLDLFLGVNNSGSTAQIGIWAAGTGANTSPNTTTLANTAVFSSAETSLNYSWQQVTATSDPSAVNYDLDAHGDPDYFLSFAVPFSNLVAEATSLGLSLNENSSVYYVFATATQANSLNQDIGGVNGGVNSSATWASLGALSDTSSPNTAVPEPQTWCLGIVAAVLIGVRNRCVRMRKPLGASS